MYLKHSALNGVSPSNAFLKANGTLWKRMWKDLKPGGDGRYQENKNFQTQEDWYTYELTESVSAGLSQMGS